jgi:hypothetical protein
VAVVLAAAPPDVPAVPEAGVFRPVRAVRGQPPRAGPLGAAEQEEDFLALPELVAAQPLPPQGAARVHSVIEAGRRGGDPPGAGAATSRS